MSPEPTEIESSEPDPIEHAAEDNEPKKTSEVLGEPGLAMKSSSAIISEDLQTNPKYLSNQERLLECEEGEILSDNGSPRNSLQSHGQLEPVSSESNFLTTEIVPQGEDLEEIPAKKRRQFNHYDDEDIVVLSDDDWLTDHI